MNIKKLNMYGYHDSAISFIKIEKGYVNIFFHKGLYVLNDNGSEIEKSEPIVLKIKVNDCLVEETSFLVNILSYNRKKKYIDVNKFNNEALKNSIDISNLYYSDFNDEVLIVASSRKHDYYLIIEECIDIDFVLLDN